MKNNYIVYEYIKAENPLYIGTRFISTIPPLGASGTLEIPENVKVIAKDLSSEDAHALCDVTKNKNNEAFLSTMPEEFREFSRQMLNKY